MNDSEYSVIDFSHFLKTPIKTSFIGVLDSGVGGLSTLATLKKVLPSENFVFYADHKHAPYGDREIADVKAIVFNIVMLLERKGAKAVVIACNTAVSAAVEELRSSFKIPILGLEPAIKLAHDQGKGGNLVLMATKLTIHGEKLKKLLQTLHIEEQVIKLPASGLVELIEAETFNPLEVRAYLKELFASISKPFYFLVLGCTHYLFVKKEVQWALEELGFRDVSLMDGNLGVAKHLKTTLKEQNRMEQGISEPWVQLTTSGAKQDQERLHYFYEQSLKMLDEN